MINNSIKLALLVTFVAISAVTVGLTTAEAIWPFDQMSGSANQTGNQSSAGNSSASSSVQPGSTQPGY